tara:strand:+ start:82 stop:300 length:219 start_codon:yes stop_codon:yes gene_type:complete
MPFLNDPYHSKAYKLLEDLETNYTDLCNLTGILPIVDNVFLPSGDIDIDKSILNLMKLINDQIKFMQKECKF